MDKNYWKDYYKKKKAPVNASLFAEYILENYLNKGETLIELGCGNGRDSVFFAKNNIKVIAIDQCDNALEILKNTDKSLNIKFICTDFTKLNEIDVVDNIYSRFTLHSVSDKEEDTVIDWAYRHLNNKGRILIETRGKKNEIYKLGQPVPNEPDAYIYNDHYRRFVDFDHLYKKLTSKGFVVKFAEEKKGFAPFENTDYTFIRIVAIKENIIKKHDKRKRSN